MAPGEEEEPSGPEEPGGQTPFFKETFGTGTYPSGSRPVIADFTDFDMKSPVTYEDASGANDIAASQEIMEHTSGLRLARKPI